MKTPTKEHMSMKKLLVTGGLKCTREQLGRLQALGYELVLVPDEKAPLTVDVSGIDAVVCFQLFSYHDIAEFKNLKLVQLTSAGMDHVPADYMRENRIELLNAKDVFSAPVSEWVVLKILEIYKGSRDFFENQRRCRWEKRRDLLELTGKTVSIIGFGDIGKAVAERLRPFGVHLVGVGRRQVEETLDRAVGRVQHPDAGSLAAPAHEYRHISDLDQVLQESDIVVLTLPLTDETRHLIDGHRISQMKENCVLVNVARGAIIHEESLVDALRQGKFLGVALDVFEEEPLREDSPLWGFDNVIITPHNASASDRAEERMFEVVYGNLRRAGE